MLIFGKNKQIKEILLDRPSNHLILTLHVSFSIMKIIKARLRNKMKDKFLAENMNIYIEQGIIENFSSGLIINEFKIF